MTQTDEQKIEERVRRLGPEDRVRLETALAEGYKNAVCRESGTVFLAFHDYVQCDSKTCPMIARDANGHSPSLLEMMLGIALPASEDKK